MTRFATLLLFLSLFTASGRGPLPVASQATLDGQYAGIHQKDLYALQRAVAAGTLAPDKAAPLIQQDADFINGARKRWASTPYRAQFEAGFQSGMTTRPAPPVQQPGQQSGQRQRPVQPPFPQPSPPFELSGIVKFVLFCVAVWICRRLWKPLPAMAAPSNIDLGAYSPLPVELSRTEKGELAEVQQNFDRRMQEIAADEARVQNQIQALMAYAAMLVARAGSAADGLTASAAAELNQDAPEFHASVAALEQSHPVAMAPWSSEFWTAFGREPKPETLGFVRYGQLEESGLLPDERGAVRPRTVPLFGGKGPIVVQCGAASKQFSRAAIQNIVIRAALAAPAEIRFSLIDPMGLGAAFPMRSLLPRVRASARTTAADELAEVVDDIRRINEDVVGQAESFASLPREKRAGEVFEIIAALDYPRAYERDTRALEYLARIAQSGPRAGRHLILEWDGDPTDADLARFENYGSVDARANSGCAHVDPATPVELQQSLLNAVAAIKSKSTGGDWNALVRPPAFFAESSTRMVQTPVGERLSFWFGDNPDGKPCAHAVLAGMTGSGKSALLHVLITGMAARYSPEELRLVLVDGKLGVEFEAYKTLPHAQVVCLRTSPAVARSVLEDFVAEMDDRYSKFQGANKLEEYREKTGLPMPRMLMVVDEYQQLLEGDPDRGAELLGRVLTQGRAAGLHLVLGSQTFEVRGLPASAMTHVHLRAALSLPVDYIQSVTAFGPEGKKLIRDLAPKGQVVINDESGRDGANARGAVARLDVPGHGVAQIIAEITGAASAFHSEPVVLSGNDAAVLADNPFVRQWRAAPPDAVVLQTTARRSLRESGFGITSWSSADRPLPLWLGRKFDVHGHMVAALKRASGHNLLALGSETGMRLCMLANGVASLRSMRPMDDCDVLLLDGLSEGQPGAGMLSVALDALRDAGARVQRAVPDSAAAALEQFAATALQPRNPEAVRLLILSEPEYFPALAAPAGYGSPAVGPSRVFKDLLRSGPQMGAHAIVTASGLGALSSVLNPSPTRDGALFNHRALQQTNEEESMTMASSMAATRIFAQTNHHMAALYVDTVQGARMAQLFKAYAASPNIYGDQSATGLRDALDSLFRRGPQ